MTRAASSLADSSDDVDISRLAVDFAMEDGDWTAISDPAAVVQAAAAALSTHRAPGLDVARAAACVVLTSDAAVRELNRTWRAKDKPTNVLSFPAGRGATDDAGRRFLGDVILAAETLHREAAAEGIPPAHHLQHLVVHGVLHLMGFDHETDADAERMEALETAVLAHLGVPDPYAGRDGDTP